MVGRASNPMPDEDGNVLKAIEGLEEAAEALEEAIDAHADADMTTRLQKHLLKLRQVIESLNEECVV
jgi:predicted RNase H-like HicB family nuclease